MGMSHEANCLETTRRHCDKKILDFGSGIGVTANYLAEHNDVTAIEPDEDSVKERWADNQYTQIIGSANELRRFADESFDMIIMIQRRNPRPFARTSEG